MEWRILDANPRIREWILHTPDGVRVARVAQADDAWSWIAGIHNLGIVLYSGREPALAPARDAATLAAERIGHLARASWTSHPGGGASLKLRGESLAIVFPSIYFDPRAYPGWMDWRISGTQIGGECLGLLNACVVASREAADYWSRPHPMMGDPDTRREPPGGSNRRGSVALEGTCLGFRPSQEGPCAG